ncbi:MAG: hypothetical protein IJK04_13655 [Kiritimatiellae bacterium]|nr:hypothetical protein [Kiritimatiellia bacterium]
MKKTSLVAVAISACALLFQGLATAAVENGGAPNLEIAFGLGAMELDKERTGIDDTGVGLNMGIRFTAETLPIGAEWRLYGGSFSLDDQEYAIPYGKYKGEAVYCDDCDYTIAGTDLSLLVNLDRNGPVNPYFGVGFLYEQAAIEADVHYDGRYRGWRYSHTYHEELDEDGVTFLFRAGLDIRAAFVYARFDAGYIGEIYDDDDRGQFMLSGDLGFHILPMLRLDCFCHYFTEYKSYYIGGGVTVAL